MGQMRVVATDIDSGDTHEWMIDEGNYALVVNDPCRLDTCRPDGTTHILTITGVEPGRTASEPVRIG